MKITTIAAKLRQVANDMEIMAAMDARPSSSIALDFVAGQAPLNVAGPRFGSCPVTAFVPRLASFSGLSCACRWIHCTFLKGSKASPHSTAQRAPQLPHDDDTGNRSPVSVSSEPPGSSIHFSGFVVRT
jgi:hypothetical protein